VRSFQFSGGSWKVLLFLASWRVPGSLCVQGLLVRSRKGHGESAPTLGEFDFGAAVLRFPGQVFFPRGSEMSKDMEC
jgi:hypothetical protein